MNRIDTLRKWIDECEEGGMVFFGGAGVSTESGIPDFRSADGVFVQLEGMSKEMKLSPEQIISRSFFDAYPSKFYEFYCDKMLFEDAKPNAAHKKLAELESQGILSAVITQNIDGLHEAAGSKKVFDLHGNVHRNYCMACHEFYDSVDVIKLHKASLDGVPRCDKCGGTIKPDVVLYEESLDSATLNGAIKAIQNSQLLIVAGTSLVVSPASGLVRYFNGKHLAIVNLSPTYADAQADLCIQAKIGEVFSW